MSEDINDPLAASDAAWTTRPRPNGAAAKHRAPPLVLIRYADISARLEGRPLVRGILERQQTSIVFGEAGCGKTFLALDIGLHVAAGLDWLGHRVAQGSVVYVAAEAAAGILNRVAAWRQASSIDELPFAAVTSPVDLCHPEVGDLGRLIAVIRAEDLGDDLALIVIDTVSRVLAGGNENAPDDMGALVRSLDRLRDELHCHVLAVHHAGKNTALGSRGHSLLRCAVDTEIHVVRDEASGIATATVTKQRDGPTEGSFSFKLQRVELGTDEDGEPVASCILEGAEASAATRKPNKLTASQKRALELLGEAIAKAGQIPPACDHIPPGVPCVTESLWREYCYAGQVSASDKPDARRQAFNRAATDLVAAGRVGKWGDSVWAVP